VPGTDPSSESGFLGDVDVEKVQESIREGEKAASSSTSAEKRRRQDNDGGAGVEQPPQAFLPRSKINPELIFGCDGHYAGSCVRVPYQTFLKMCASCSFTAEQYNNVVFLLRRTLCTFDILLGTHVAMVPLELWTLMVTNRI